MIESSSRSRLVSLVVAACCLAACSADVGRCSKCGMDVTKSPRWVAGFSLDHGSERLFCSPRCLFAWKDREQVEGSAWVTEYYSQQRLAASEAYFVVGSDVVGPMGPALVPVKGAEAAERFRLDHGGERVVRLHEITVELLRSLKNRS